MNKVVEEIKNNVNIVDFCREEIINCIKKQLNLTDKFDIRIIEQLAKHNNLERLSITLHQQYEEDFSEEQKALLKDVIDAQNKMVEENGMKIPKDKEFKPMSFTFFIQSNPDYNPDKFSQKIHDSEPEEDYDAVTNWNAAVEQLQLWSCANGIPAETKKLMDELEKKKPFMNSEQWKKNERYISTHELKYRRPLIDSQQYKIRFHKDDVDIPILYRTMCSVENFKRVKEEIKKLNDKGIDVIDVCV